MVTEADSMKGYMDHTYTCRADVSQRVWARLATWDQLISVSQARALDSHVKEMGTGRERSAAGEARPLPPELVAAHRPGLP